jgi:superfamily II DNA or RNA helicase
MPLRYYQSDAKSAVLFALEEFERVLCNIPTGGGKTVLAAHIIAEMQPKRCLFLADQDELCQQPLTVIDRECHIIPALEKAKYHASLNAKVVVASSQTLSNEKRLYRFPYKFFDLAIVDEAHRGRKRDRKITDHLAKKVLGITATPFDSQLRDLSEDFEEIAYALPMLNLIEDGFAPPYKVLRLPVEIDLAAVETKRGFEGEGKDYDAESLSTTIAPYYERICDLILEHAANRKIIAFLPLISSSQAFAAIARSKGIQAVHIDGKSGDRDEIIESFRRGRIQMLTNANVVETGVDIPVADCFVNLRPTRSAVKYQQAFGRVLRVLPRVVDDIPGRHQAEERRQRIAESAKPDALIIDFLWQHDQLGIYKPENMIAGSEEEAKAIYEKLKLERSPADILRIQKLIQEEREALVAKRLEEVALRSPGNAVHFEEFGKLIGSPSIERYAPQANWETAPPSPAQIAKLQQWGIDTSAVNTRGLASKLMDAYIHRVKFRMASINQLRTLAKLGVEYDPSRLTMRDATRLITEAKITLARKPSI